jgi:hypothetical protein
MVNKKVLPALILGLAVASLNIACSKKDSKKKSFKEEVVVKEKKNVEEEKTYLVTSDAALTAGLINENEASKLVKYALYPEDEAALAVLMESTATMDGNVIVRTFNEDQNLIVIASRKDLCKADLCDDDGNLNGTVKSDAEGRISFISDQTDFFVLDLIDAKDGPYNKVITNDVDTRLAP